MKRASLYAGAILMAIFATSACTADSKTSNQEDTAMTQNTNELVKIDTVVGQGRDQPANPHPRASDLHVPFSTLQGEPR